MAEDRLYRSTQNKMIAGVAGGIAEHLKVDSSWIRILFLLLAFFVGGGLIIYIILWIFIPENENYLNHSNMETENSQEQKDQFTENSVNDQQKDDKAEESKKRGNLIGGLVLIGIGIIFLIDQYIPKVDIEDMWPVLLIIFGIALIVNGVSKSSKKEKKY